MFECCANLLAHLLLLKSSMAYHLGQYSLQLFLLKSFMLKSLTHHLTSHIRGRQWTGTGPVWRPGLRGCNRFAVRYRTWNLRARQEMFRCRSFECRLILEYFFLLGLSSSWLSSLWLSSLWLSSLWSLQICKSIVTRWQDYFFDFWSSTTMKICLIAYKIWFGYDFVLGMHFSESKMHFYSNYKTAITLSKRATRRRPRTIPGIV